MSTVFTQSEYLARVKKLCESKSESKSKVETAQAAKAESKSTSGESKRKFADVMQAYCNAYIKGVNDVVLKDTIQTLSNAVAFSVLRKCIDKSGDKMLFAMRGELSSDIKAQEFVLFADENAFNHYYNVDGEYKTETVDKDVKRRLDELTAQTLGDGCNLASAAKLYIWKYSVMLSSYALLPLAAENAESTFLEYRFPERRLKQKVYIKSPESANAFETVLTCAITEIFKGVRREIIAHKNACDNSKYMYIDETVKDGESGIVETIYKRFHKYACISGTVANGANDYLPCESKPQQLVTVDRQIAFDLDNIVSDLNLSARQMKVLERRLEGYGYKAIGTYLGVDHSNVIRTCKQIQKKLLASGYNPPQTIIATESAQAAAAEYETAAAAQAAAAKAAENAAKALAYCKACQKERLAIGFYELHKQFKETAAQAAAAAEILSARESVKAAAANAGKRKAAAAEYETARKNVNVQAAAAEYESAQAAAQAKAAQAKAQAAAQAKAAAAQAAAAQAKAAKAAENVQIANFYKKAAQAAAAKAKAAESVKAAAAFNATAADYMTIYYRIAN